VASRTLSIVIGVYILMLSQKFNWQHLLGWYLLLLAVLCGRWYLCRLYRKDRGTHHSLSRWLFLFRLGIFGTGMMVGGLNLLFFSFEPVSLLLIAIILPCGTAVAAVTMLLDVTSFFIYALTLLSPIVYQTGMAGDRHYLGVAILACLFGAFLFRFSREYNRNFINNARLRYENKQLLEDIEEEKNKLNNRLGRILNDSTTEIYVVDANSLMCVQVNQGAVDKLGYSREEFKNVSLLDIFVDLDKESFSDLLLPAYRGKWEPIVHKGVSRRKDGSTFPVEASIQLSVADDPPIIVANVQDITERTRWEEQLIYQANYDQLTGLHNRHYIQSYMHSAFNRAERHGKKLALLFMDLDNFKDINDTLGHDTGDEVLKQTAQRLSSLLRETDTAARTGGDEFTIFLENLDKTRYAGIVAQKIIRNLQQPIMLEGRELYTSVSIGISIFPDDGMSHERLMQCADLAMYQAKKDGRNTYRYFSDEMRRVSEEQMLISNQLRYALSRDEFSLVFQPKIDVKKSCIVGAEALLRWNNRELGNVSPYIFIPLAENIGIINEIGVWVLEQACLEATTWQGLTDEKLKVSVNVSPQQFRNGSLLEDVEDALKKSALSCDQLELEITESLLMQDSDKPLAILGSLHKRGVSLALDDFGTGYSSLSYLRRFPLQVLKIDRSFIQDLEIDQNHKTLVDAIIAMAQSLKLEIVAEGVENENQLQYLRQRDVGIIQGYLFSPPVPAEEFRTLLKKSRQGALPAARA
ncbi:MAG: EAL domain-containing protein, partial [Desulfocapsaceae bacterium]|nr:EAL domain-containing protein [Desulfocapsaceae bacterium]